MKKEVLNVFTSPCAVIIVTHNSEQFLEKCLNALNRQSFQPTQIIVVDSGSNNLTALKTCVEKFSVKLHVENENVGFCVGNNIGLSYVQPDAKYVLFLNPDAYLTPTYLEEATRYLESEYCQDVGAIAGLLLGYDNQLNQPTGLIDSAGIEQKLYGRWYDRGQGESIQTLHSNYNCAQFVSAICGAAFFCRLDALKQVQFAENVVMDPSFYMYKEDIDLSVRLRQKGWNLLYVPDLIAYHCRGWKQDRAKMPYDLRLISAQNEMNLHARFQSPHYLYSAIKYFLVKYLNV